MLHDPVDHVGHGLEAAVGVPRSALGLAGGVFDLSHLIEMDERIEVGKVDSLEGALDGKPFTFETGRCRRYRQHRAIGSGRVERSSDTGEAEYVRPQ